MASLAEAQSPNVMPATFLSHFRKIRDAKRIADEANMGLASAKKAAKMDGIDLKATKIIEDLNKLDDDEADMRLKKTFTYMRWLELPFGGQASLFPEVFAMPNASDRTKQNEWEAADAGYAAGKGGKLRSDNPFPAGSPLYVAWDAQFLRGLTVLGNELDVESATQADKRLDQSAAKQAQPQAQMPPSVTAPLRRRTAKNSAANTLTH